MSATRSYGILESESFSDSISTTELSRQGYTVLPDVLSAAQLTEARDRLDAVYARQEAEFGRERLAEIDELDLARLPLAFDDWFIELAANPTVLAIVRKAIGDYAVLHLQNGILNRPGQAHHQSAWHRDLPYQEWTSSKPLAISALFCIEPFTTETGGTHVLPGSHRFDRLPPAPFVDKHAVVASAPAGSVIVFDCMLYHRAGQNRSASVRRGINHVYTIPLIKQQIDLPQALGGKHADKASLARLLGYTSSVPTGVVAWRNERLSRRRKSATAAG